MKPTICIVLLLLSATGTVWAQSPPVISGLETNPLTFREGDPPLPLSSSVRLDSDNPITRVVVQLTGNVADEDQLAFPDTEAIRGVVDEANGTLFLLSYPARSSRPAVSFQNALRSVTYQNTNEVNPETNGRTVSLQAFDNQGQTSDPANRTLTVVAENDAPSVTLANDDPITYPTGTGVEIPMFGTAEVSDGDSQLLTSAEVTISTGFQNGEDQLSLTDVPAELSVTGNGSGTLTLSGPAPPAAFQRALRNVQFTNENPLVLPTEGTRRVTVSVFDGTAESVPVSRFVVVGSSADTPPRIRAFSKEVTSGDTLSFTSAEFEQQYSDTENDPFTGIYIRSKPERGTLLLRGEEVTNNRINGAGPNGLRIAPSEFAALTYQAPTDYLGEDQFLWNAIDGTTFAANSKPVRILINPPELQLSLGTVDALSASANQPLSLPPLAFSATRPVPVTVTLSVNNGVISLPAEITPLLTFVSGDGTNDASMVFTGGADAVEYALSGIRYTSDENYNGNETLSVSVSSSNNTSAQTTVAITVISNSPPTVRNLTISTVEDQAYVFRLADFTERYQDSDNAPSVGPSRIHLTALPQNGTFVYRSDSLRSADISTSEGYAIPVEDMVAGELTYVPNPGFSGSDQARWNAFDGAVLATSDAVIEVTVLPALAIALAQDSIAVCSGNTTTLQVTVVSANEEITYNWSCPGDCGFEQSTDQATVVVSPAQTTTYVVSVTNSATTESAEDVVIVVVEECPKLTLIIPNTFTPNGDDANNEWNIGSQVVSPVAVEVFDRYGHSVYRNEEYQDKWDGTYQGQPLPEGTYYYLVTDANGEVYKGPLTILR